MGLGGVEWLEKLEIKPTQPQFELKLKLGLSLAKKKISKQLGFDLTLISLSLHS